jgi:hypothetical protein
MALKYQRWLPKLIITQDMIDAFAHNDPHMLHPLIGLKPWEFSPLTCQWREPKPGQTPADYRGDPWRSSWWRAAALREKLLELSGEEEIAEQEEGTAQRAV